MKRTAALCALALTGLAGFAGGALAWKGEPEPPSQPPGHSGSPPGQQKQAQPAAPAQSARAANPGTSAKPANGQGQKPKPKPKKTASSSHAKAGKITICHRTGSERNPWVQITVSANAWKAHQKHGDLNPVPAGGCPTGGQPGGGGGGGGDHNKITICHRTGSETNPWVEITISENAWPAHREHGDLNPVPPGGCPALVSPPTTTTTTGAATTTPGTTTTAVTPAAVPIGATTTPAAAAGQPSVTAKPSAPTAAGPTPAARAPTRGEQQKPARSSISAKRGVLAAAGELGAGVQRQELPFTGLPLWPLVLGAAGLAGAGLGVRRWTRSARNA